MSTYVTAAALRKIVGGRNQRHVSNPELTKKQKRTARGTKAYENQLKKGRQRGEKKKNRT